MMNAKIEVFSQISFRTIRQKFNGFIFLSLLCYFHEASCQNKWQEVWSDHFSGNKLSAENWKAETGTGNNGWGNQELEYYTSDESNLRVAEGELQIIAKKEEKGGKAFTSARIKTQDLRYWQYGRVEAKIRLPWGKGLWPAFWMLGQEISKAGWPKCGEIDVMEHVNEVLEINGTIHWDSAGRKYHGGTIQLNNPHNFHLYAVEWDTEKITWLLDEKPYWVELIGKNRPSRSEFHGYFFLLFNLAVGGDWPGSPDSTTSFPDTMHVDYVRVLKKAEAHPEVKHIKKKNQIQHRKSSLSGWLKKEEWADTSENS